MRAKTLILIMIAMCCGLLATIGISQVIDRNAQGGPVVETDKIFVAAADIDIGDAFTADIHSPSGCMDKYEDTPQRRRVKQARASKPPIPLARWCYLDLASEPPLPIDDATSPCDDEVVGPAVRRFDRQHPGLEIKEPDVISDSGEEIFNFFEQEGIKNVVMMGVHTNMCVLGRPFGIRQLVRLGKNVVLARDMTDAMYDPRQAPWVSHARGTELVIEHIEQYWCPTIQSKDLTVAASGRTS